MPFSFRVLMSGDPQLCASLVAEALEDEGEGSKSRIFAISSTFERGFERLKKFCAIAREAVAGNAPTLVNAIDETLTFLGSQRERYLLLETVELDMLTEEGGQALRASVERELAECTAAGEAVDALAADVSQAVVQLMKAAARAPGKPWWRVWRQRSALDVLSGLVLDDGFDSTRDGSTRYPLGLGEWGNVLYYQPFDRAQFEEHVQRTGKRP